MLRKLMTVCAVAGTLVATPSLAASQCKDAQGKFIKCPPATKPATKSAATPAAKPETKATTKPAMKSAAKPETKSTAKPAATPAAKPEPKSAAKPTATNVVKGKDGKCRVASGPKKGQFAKCD